MIETIEKTEIQPTKGIDGLSFDQHPVDDDGR